ncbi:hypothetical protein IAU67_02520 [Corynebacterium zhongnanshanii]|uniref:hypothetical protein n=1 Tax=Corynebacterium TaxID=1716 RepID=UPI0016592166|nr:MULTISPECIES: hypothetical protein [Corynebacterium]QNP92691.1 hypothetical protein IAU67_02520 [Corynebacterium zhongnanshanii]
MSFSAAIGSSLVVVFPVVGFLLVVAVVEVVVVAVAEVVVVALPVVGVVFPCCSGANAPLTTNSTMDAIVMVPQCRFIGSAPFFSRFSWISHQIPGRAIASPAQRL